MNFDSFINCLTLKTPNSGNLIGYYDFKSGDGRIFKNLIHENSGFYFTGLGSTGQLVTGINSNLLPAIVFSDSPSSFYNTGLFSGEDFVRIGRSIEGEEFSFLIRYDGRPCKSVEYGSTPQVLLSSNNSGFASGFNLGINASNRLFFEYRSSGNIKIKTFHKELSEKNVASVLLNKTTLTMGVYDFTTETVSSEDFYLNDFVSSNILYVGKDRFNSSSTGFFGEIKNLAIFNSHIADASKFGDECFFCSGYEPEHNETIYYTGYFLTGSESPVSQETGVTGYQRILSSFLDENGDPIYLSVESGLTGIISTTTGYKYLTGSGSFNYQEFVPGKEFYNSGEKRSYINNLNYHFKGGSLSSGDYIQIYSYTIPIFTHSFKVVDLNYSPEGDDSIFLNGLFSTDGEEFTVSRGLVNSGVDLKDSLRFDNLNSASLVFKASGVWLSNRLLLNACNVATGAQAVYFPSQAQFIETGNGTVSFTGFNSTGITGFDFYLNGQKLTNEYQTGTISGNLSYSLPSGYVRDWQGEITSSPCNDTNDYTVVSHKTFDVIAFVPKIYPSQLLVQEKLYTGNSSKLDIKISGYSEQIWLNGVRQFVKENYNKSYDCSLNDSFVEFDKMPLIFYNNGPSLFNIE